MLRQPKLFTAIIIFASFFGCKTAQIQTEKPAEAYQSSVFKPKPSTINLPVEMDINDIETMAKDNALHNGEANARSFKLGIRVKTLKNTKSLFAYCISNPVPLSLTKYTVFCSVCSQ